MGVAGDFYMIYVGGMIKGLFLCASTLSDTRPVWLLSTERHTQIWFIRASCEPVGER